MDYDAPFALATVIATLLALAAEVPLSQERVIESMPASTSHRIINKLLLPLRTAVAQVMLAIAGSMALLMSILGI